MPRPETERVCAGPLALEIAWKDRKVASLALAWSEGLAPSPDPSSPALALAAALAEYAAGVSPLWPSLPLDLERLSPFARDVLIALRDNVFHGATVSYGALARLGGHPGAARACGRVMAANPWPLVIPCHRVLGARGQLIGFAGCGLPMKQFLLKLEGAR